MKAVGEAAKTTIGSATRTRQLPKTFQKNTKIRGSIIGGTALVDTNVIQEPYPNTVIASTQTEYLEWKTTELRYQAPDLCSSRRPILAPMGILTNQRCCTPGISCGRTKRSKLPCSPRSTWTSWRFRPSAQSAPSVFWSHKICVMQGIRRQRDDDDETLVHQRLSGVDRELRDQSMHEFSILIKAVCSDGRIHPSERKMVREFMANNDLSTDSLRMMLGEQGWTIKEWDEGIKLDSSAIEDKIKNIPEMLRASGIRSRVSSAEKQPEK